MNQQATAEAVRTQRLYPDHLPLIPYEATAEDFYILSETDTGDGLVSSRRFLPGQVVFDFQGVLTTKVTLFSLQVLPGLFVHDPHVMGKVLHDCDPNCSVDMLRMRFTARRAISPGEPVTMDYETTEDHLFRGFHCACGRPNCRGWIKGRGEPLWP